MKPFAAIVLTACACILAGCGKDPRKVQITEKNRHTFMEEIKDMKGLTVEEIRLLIAQQVTDGMKKSFGGEERQVVGKTVGDLLTDLKKEAAEQEHEAKKQERLAAEAKAKEDARSAELRKAINLTVIDKGFAHVDYEDYITINVAYENTSGKDIRAFEGKVQFTDLFGKEIYKSGLTISDPVKAGDKKIWRGNVKYNQFIDAQKNLRLTELANMKVVWKPSNILFTDGSRVGEQP